MRTYSWPPVVSTERLLLLAASLVLTISWPTVSQPAGISMHTVFGTECNAFFDWQTLGLVYSHRKAGVPGPITRLLSCSEKELVRYSNANLVSTHIAPSWHRHPVTGDEYPALNKPVAIQHWLEHVNPPEEWILVIDPDMILRHKMADWGPRFGAGPGWAVGVYFNYMIGTHNNLSDTHIPEVWPRVDTLAGPKGRRSDQVSAIILMQREDLRRLVPLWLHYSEAVREDPMAWNETNDEYATKPGMKPWISEMYGYSFGAAKADIWHRIDYACMVYPGKPAIDAPRILHYGRLFQVGAYKFRKHWFHQFKATLCPPWAGLAKRSRGHVGGLFPHPPRPSELPQQGVEDHYRDLLSIQVVATLNAAFCEHHLQHCGESEVLLRECTQVRETEADVDAALAAIETHADPSQPAICRDEKESCAGWAERGQCATQPSYMHYACRHSCGLCLIPFGQAQANHQALWPPPHAYPPQALDRVPKVTRDWLQARGLQPDGTATLPAPGALRGVPMSEDAIPVKQATALTTNYPQDQPMAVTPAGSASDAQAPGQADPDPEASGVSLNSQRTPQRAHAHGDHVMAGKGLDDAEQTDVSLDHRTNEPFERVSIIAVSIWLGIVVVFLLLIWRMHMLPARRGRLSSYKDMTTKFAPYRTATQKLPY